MKNVSAEKININEYIKSKLKAFVETFATLGEIIGGTSSVAKMTDAEIKAAEIWKANPKSAKAIEMLEARETIPEKGEGEVEKKNTLRGRSSYRVEESVQQQESVKDISKNRTKPNGTRTIDDDYVQ